MLLVTVIYLSFSPLSHELLSWPQELPPPETETRSATTNPDRQRTELRLTPPVREEDGESIIHRETAEF